MRLGQVGLLILDERLGGMLRSQLSTVGLTAKHIASTQVLTSTWATGAFARRRTSLAEIATGRARARTFKQGHPDFDGTMRPFRIRIGWPPLFGHEINYHYFQPPLGESFGGRHFDQRIVRVLLVF